MLFHYQILRFLPVNDLISKGTIIYKKICYHWTTHVDKLCTTLKQRLGLMRRIKCKLNSHKLQIIAEAIFQSKIRYGISVYTIPKFEFNNLEQAMDPNIAKIQVIQNDMMRLLKGTNRKSHTNMEKLRKELKMMSVNQLSVYHVAIEMFNIINNKSSESLHEQMKLESRGYGLRGLDEGKVKVPEKGKNPAMVSITWAQSCGTSCQSISEKPLSETFSRRS